MLNIAIVIGSTRPGRKAEAVAQWVHTLAAKRGDANGAGRAVPAEYERDIGLALRQIEAAEMVLNGSGNSGTHDVATQVNNRAQRLKDFPRQ